jgi:hypothetical protein
MSSMRLNARLDTSHHGQPHPFEDAGVVADSLTGNHNSMSKCLFVINRSFSGMGIQVPPPVNIQRIQIWRAWKSCSGSSSTYPSVMIGVVENISHGAAKMTDNWIDHDSILSAIAHKLNISIQMLIRIFFLLLVCGTRAQNLSATFSYTLYMYKYLLAQTH